MEPGETRLGLLVPSSNTNAEPLTAAVLAGLHVTALASRFALPRDLGAAIDDSLLGTPADLVCEAGISSLAFHGTSGTWLGLDRDSELAGRLSVRTGVPATTASLATVRGLQTLGVRRVGLAFPGPAVLADRIAEQFALAGISVVSRSVPATPLSNPEISDLPLEQVAEFVSAAAGSSAGAVVCVGTNLRAGYLVAELERSLGVAVVDSALATVWELLSLAGIKERPGGWGRLLSEAG